jgi:hypothetical protein
VKTEDKRIMVRNEEFSLERFLLCFWRGGGIKNLSV